MKKPRTMAYALAKKFDLNELEEVSGGGDSGSIRGKIFIPTVKITGRPFLPDSECDSRYV